MTIFEFFSDSPYKTRRVISGLLSDLFAEDDDHRCCRQ